MPPSVSHLEPVAGPAVDFDVVLAEELPGRRWAFGAPLVRATVVASFVAAALFPLPTGLTREGAYALAALVSAILLWGSGIEDPSFGGLLVVLVLSFLGVISFRQAVAGFGTEFVWLLVATFIIAQATADVGLGRRIALVLLRRAGDKPAMILLTLLAAVVVLSFMVPTAAGRISMILPVCLGIIESAQTPPSSRFAKAMLVGTSHASIMAGIGLMTAAGATLYAAGAFESLIGMRWGYLAWVAAYFPLVVIFTIILWRMLMWVFPPERVELIGSAIYVNEQLQRMGHLGLAERKMLAVFTGMLALWVVGPRVSITTPQAGMLGALVLMLPGFRLLSWDRAVAAVRWNVVMLFGVSLALATALERSGAGKWLIDTTLSMVERPSALAVVAVLAPLVMLIRIGFVNNLGMIAVALPLVFTLAKGWGLNPGWVGMVVVLTAGPGFLLPTQTPTGVITLGYEYYTIRDYMRLGLPASIVLLLLTWAAALFYWPLLGYRP